MEPQEELQTFLSGLYKFSHLNYSKFFKMDRLCKLGLLAAELVTKETQGFDVLPKNEMALIFSNHASSLDSDRQHAATIADKQNYFPSPSVFVYTLPNIVAGEIAIRHKITGENAFFITDAFNADLMFTYSDILLKTSTTSSALCGWVNVDASDAEAFVYCIKNLNFKHENNGFQRPHHSNSLQELYSLAYGSTGHH
jgi:hypothetical protein